MTDYLEESLDNANQLLERVRQSEQELAGVKRNGGEAGDSGGDFARSKFVSGDSLEVYNWEDAVEETIRLADNGEHSTEIGINDEEEIVNHTAEMERDLTASPPLSAGQDGGTGQRDVTLGTEEVDEGAGESVLAAQLERLDRAASVPAAGGEGSDGDAERRDRYPVSLSGLRPGTVYPRIAGAAEEEWPAPGGRSSGQASSGGAVSWAEQADRTFRRDSRRYDGGFYLY